MSDAAQRRKDAIEHLTYTSLFLHPFSPHVDRASYKGAQKSDLYLQWYSRKVVLLPLLLSLSSLLRAFQRCFIDLHADPLLFLSDDDEEEEDE